jgi:hypothetical protein
LSQVILFPPMLWRLRILVKYRVFYCTLRREFLRYWSHFPQLPYRQVGEHALCYTVVLWQPIIIMIIIMIIIIPVCVGLRVLVYSGENFVVFWRVFYSIVYSMETVLSVFTSKWLLTSSTITIYTSWLQGTII